MCPDRLYNFRQAAELLGIPESTLRKKVTAGQMPHRRGFRHARFSGAEPQAIQELRPVRRRTQ